MVSLYCAIGLFGAVSIWLAYLRKCAGKENYRWYSCMAGFLLSRLFLYCMQESHADLSVFRLAADAGTVLLLFVISGKNTSRINIWKYIWLYTCSPAVLACMFSGKLYMQAVTAVFCAAALFLRFRAGAFLTEKMISALWKYYMVFSTGGFFYMTAVNVLEQSWDQCAAGDGVYPVLLILSAAAFLAGAVHFVYTAISWKTAGTKIEDSAEEQSRGITENGQRNKKQEAEPFSNKDIVYMGILTVVYACLIFKGLGSTSAPETELKLGTGEGETREMILDLGEETEISKISIFLGRIGKRTLSFSSLNGDTKTWEVFDSKRNIESVFCWNEIKVDKKIRTLGIVCMDHEAYIREIVILDKNGKQLRPKNASVYQASFDEQMLYPEDNTYFYRTMFDEVYHARTAYELVHHDPIYETTHPPLGKEIMGIGIRMFGMTPFGWRFMGAVLGILVIPVSYLFAKTWSGSRKIAFFIAALCCTEFMLFTLSRIATIDIYVAFFAMLMFALMYGSIRAIRLRKNEKRYLIGCGLATGCGIAAKWTGLYAAFGLMILFLGFLITEYGSREKIYENRSYLFRLFLVCVFSFIILPAGIYCLSYLPYKECGYSGGLLEIVSDSFRLMLNYHKDRVFEHPYSSEWYEWFWDKQTLLDALTVLKSGKISTVATFGNPVVFLAGILAFLYNMYLWRIRENGTSGYLCTAYLAMLLPWLFVHRTVFIYQYFICDLIQVQLIGHACMNLKRDRGKVMAGLLLAAFLAFLLFYPVISGYPAERKFIDQVLEWLRSWRFA